MYPYKFEEIFVVFLSHTLSDPNTMMVKLRNANIAYPAML